jgi:hydrogenase assembly chaperone HypC/HupF
MCIGIPLRIIATQDLNATCVRRNGEQEAVDLSLIGPQPVGTWLLVHLGSARSVLTAEDAARVSDALLAIEAVQRGENIDHLFADLTDREPQLPPHLRKDPPCSKA